MAYRLVRRAEADLDDIAHYIAIESGSPDIAKQDFAGSYTHGGHA